MKKSVIAFVLLLLMSFVSMAQDVVLSLVKDETVKLSISGFADKKQSEFSCNYISGGKYEIVDKFDMNSGMMSLKFLEAGSYVFDFEENFLGCNHITTVKFEVKDDQKHVIPEPRPDPGTDPTLEPNPEPEPGPDPEPEPNIDPEPEPDPEQGEIVEELKVNVPNIFTPNGDGKNDLFHLSYNYKPQSFRIDIFSRSGKRVYSSENPDFEWDGGNCLFGTYFYVMNYLENNSPKKVSGIIMLAKDL